MFRDAMTNVDIDTQSVVVSTLRIVHVDILHAIF